MKDERGLQRKEKGMWIRLIEGYFVLMKVDSLCAVANKCKLMPYGIG